MFTISATGLYQPVILVDIFTPCCASLIWLPGIHGYPHAVVTVQLGLWMKSQPGFPWFPDLRDYDRAWLVSGITTRVEWGPGCHVGDEATIVSGQHHKLVIIPCYSSCNWVIESHFVCLVARISSSLWTLVCEWCHSPGFQGCDIILGEHLLKVMTGRRVARAYGVAPTCLGQC